MIRNLDVFQKLCQLVKKALPLIETAKEGAFYPDKISKYPNLETAKSGFPSISLYPSPIDISRFWRPRYEGSTAEIPLHDFPEFHWLFEKLKSTPEYAKFFRLAGKEEADDKTFSFLIEDYIESFVERYYYIHGLVFFKKKFEKIYLLAENFMYADIVHFDLGIPILFLKLDIDNFKINDQLAIRRINSENQRARYKVTTYSPHIVESVYMSATHEFVLKNLQYIRQPTFYSSFHFDNSRLYPINYFERIFTILKLVTDFTSGFAQILIYPNDWADRYFADLRDINGMMLRNYPVEFDEFYWNRNSFPIVSKKQLSIFRRLFNRLDKLENKVDIALKRLYKSMMRENEEDIVIDLIIALELLLSDNEKNDISYKLAMRIAALLCEHGENNYKSSIVFSNVKKMYDYRSAIVHGSTKKLASKREVSLPDNQTMPVVEIAKEYLREILRIMIEHPIYLDSKEVDAILLRNN
jgi:hypothetical protein